MDSISSINITSDYLKNAITQQSSNTDSSNSFASALDSAMGLLKETSSLTNDAEQAAVDFALGNVENSHDVAVAQQKALTSLQYTVAIKNAVMSAYKEIMNIQI